LLTRESKNYTICTFTSGQGIIFYLKSLFHLNKVNLCTQTLIRIRFSDVDSMGVVWHGQYMKYFEDGREDFGDKFGINYLDFYKRGFLTPIVKIDCSYKKSLVYGDTALIETRYVDCEAAKILFEYTIYNNSTREVVAIGSSTQVFLNLQHELLLWFPPFYLEWKQTMGY
jgi:acyl-CoA thioester hydrolase